VFHHLQVIAEDQLVVPSVAVLADRPTVVTWTGQRIGYYVFFTFLAVVNKLILPFLWRKEDWCPVWRNVLALL
jgi:hypothetical protein